VPGSRSPSAGRGGVSGSVGGRQPRRVSTRPASSDEAGPADPGTVTCSHSARSSRRMRRGAKTRAGHVPGRPRPTGYGRHTRWWKTRPPEPQRDQGLEMYLDDVIPEPNYRICHSRVIRTPATVVRYIIEAGTSSRPRRRCVSCGGRIRGGVRGVSSSRHTGSPRKFGSQRALDEPEARLGHHDEHGNPGDIAE
jgi:hypothetical protein